MRLVPSTYWARGRRWSCLCRASRSRQLTSYHKRAVTLPGDGPSGDLHTVAPDHLPHKTAEAAGSLLDLATRLRAALLPLGLGVQVVQRRRAKLELVALSQLCRAALHKRRLQRLARLRGRGVAVGVHEPACESTSWPRLKDTPVWF